MLARPYVFMVYQQLTTDSNASQPPARCRRPIILNFVYTRNNVSNRSALHSDECRFHSDLRLKAFAAPSKHSNHYQQSHLLADNGNIGVLGRFFFFS